MIFCEIGKGRHFIVKACHSVQRNGVGRYLHNHILAAGITHLGKERLQIKALRRSTLCGDHLITDHILHGAHQSNLRPQHLFQHVLEQQCGGGFSVGAGYADELHSLSRMAVEICADQSQRQSVRVHLHVRHFLCLRLGGHNRHSAVLQRHRDILVAVGCKARDRHEQAAGGYLAGVIDHRGDLHIHIHIGIKHIDTCKQLT